MKSILLIILCMLCTISMYGQQEKKKVVIGSSLGNNVSEDIRSIFEDAIREGLSSTDKYRVIENREIYAKIATGEKNFQESGWVDEKQMMEFAKTAGVDYACYARISVIAENYFISCSMIDLNSGENIGSFSVNTENGNKDLVNAANEIIFALKTGKKSLEIKREMNIPCPGCCWNGSKFIDGYIYYQDELPGTWQETVDKCRKKGDGWYLPSREELEQIYNKQEILIENGSALFGYLKYWTSSRNNKYDSYFINFKTGEQDYDSNTYDYSCRCLKQGY